MSYHETEQNPVVKNIFVKEWNTPDRQLYLTRINLTPMTRFGQLCLHIFHRADAEAHPYHSHPYKMWTFALWNGYIEEYIQLDKNKQAIWSVAQCWATKRERRSWLSAKYYDGSRAHKIVRVLGRICITLMWRSPDYREWELFHPDGTITYGNNKGRPKEA